MPWRTLERRRPPALTGPSRTGVLQGSMGRHSPQARKQLATRLPCLAGAEQFVPGELQEGWKMTTSSRYESVQSPRHSRFPLHGEAWLWLCQPGKQSDGMCSDFCKAFDMVSYHILLGKLRNYGLDEWSVRWIENWLNGRAQRVGISGAESGWRPGTSGVPQGQYWAQPCLTSSSMTWMKS